MSTSPTSPKRFAVWRKSTHSGGDGNCVEVAVAVDGTVGVRHSKNRDGAHLHFTPYEWRAFIDGVKRGEFDQP